MFSDTPYVKRVCTLYKWGRSAPVDNNFICFQDEVHIPDRIITQIIPTDSKGRSILTLKYG